MRFLQKLLSALIGFVFTLGGFGKVSAREVRPTTEGTVVVARENRGPSIGANSVDALRQGLILLAASKDTKGKSKNKTKGKNGKTKSKSKTKTTKKKKRSPKR